MTISPKGAGFGRPRIGSFCTGIAGLDLATSAHFGADIVWHCEFDAAPSKVLAHHFSDVPNHGDITATDWADVAPIDILTAGYPCQPFSNAGQRKGNKDERHIWPAIRNAIGDLRPRVVVLENVRGHLSLGFAEVLADLAGLGFDAEWGTFRSSDVGAPHRRERLYVVATSADADGIGSERAGGPRDGWPELADSGRPTANTNSVGRSRGQTRPKPAMVREDRFPTFRGESLSEPKGSHGLTADADGERSQGPQPTEGQQLLNWGSYGAAVSRWEKITGTVAPAPLDEKGRLAPALAEWMMGYPAGWVTDPAIGLTRAQQLKACGNAVQPQTAALALHNLTRITE